MNRDILGYVAIYSFVSIIFLFIAILVWGVNNDYIISGIHDYSLTANSSGIISSSVMNTIDTTAEANAGLSMWFDLYWLLGYLVFIGSTLMISYYAEQEGEFGFLGMLFYGSMIMLFIFSLAEVLTGWLSAILYQLIPNIEGTLPMFSYWLEYAGMFTFIHLLLCMVINKFNLNIKQSILKKNDTLGETGGEIL